MPLTSANTDSVVSYTLRLTTDEALRLDDLTTVIRRRRRSRTDKSEIFRALLEMTENEMVRSELLRVLEAHSAPRGCSE